MHPFYIYLNTKLLKAPIDQKWSHLCRLGLWKPPDGDPRILQNPAQSAKGEERGDSERNPLLAKMVFKMIVYISKFHYHQKAFEEIHSSVKFENNCHKKVHFCIHFICPGRFLFSFIVEKIKSHSFWESDVVFCPKNDIRW